MKALASHDVEDTLRLFDKLITTWLPSYCDGPNKPLALEVSKTVVWSICFIGVMEEITGIAAENPEFLELLGDDMPDAIDILNFVDLEMQKAVLAFQDKEFIIGVAKRLEEKLPDTFSTNAYLAESSDVIFTFADGTTSSPLVVMQLPSEGSI